MKRLKMFFDQLLALVPHTQLHLAAWRQPSPQELFLQLAPEIFTCICLLTQNLASYTNSQMSHLLLMPTTTLKTPPNLKRPFGLVMALKSNRTTAE